MNTENSRNLLLRKAAIGDVKQIHTLLLGAAASGQLLARPLSDLYNHVREFFVLQDQNSAENRIVGCVALSIVWLDMAEIRSLFVAEEVRLAGFGRLLIEAGLEEARELGVLKVFTLTYQVEFFKKFGFQEVSKDTLPQKIWSICINCPKFPDCDETAMMVAL